MPSAPTRLFGTDGVRGLANADLTPELALAVASAAARVLAGSGAGADSSTSGRSGRPTAIVGRDPRASGEMLEAAVVAGLTSAGTDVIRVGVLPTPAVAFLTGHLGADLGVMLSASHNAMPDNGIKIFASGGQKLDDSDEARIEAEVERATLEQATLERGENRWSGKDRPTGSAVGRVRDLPDAREAYLQHLLKARPARLDGLKVVVDCANGAAAFVAPELLRRAGAEVIAIGAEPDGLNINDGVGSTHLDHLAAAVLRHGADVGIAHDGDADRCLAVASDGTLVDGDQILALAALELHAAGHLAQATVVATVMSNLGFHQAMNSAGITVICTPVGDRYVLEELRARGLTLGGEQSGHLIFTDAATTGDGLLTALHLLGCVRESGRPLAELAAIVVRLPQVLINVEVADKATVAGSPAVAEAVRAAEEELDGGGRILLRPSGTENLVRVMVEAATSHQARTVAEVVAAVVASV